MDNKPTWPLFIAKVIEFIRYLLSFFKRRKEEQQKIQQEKKDKAIRQVKNGYAEIDEDREKKKKDDIQKRLNNLF